MKFLTIILLSFSFSASAKIVARVLNVQGNAFSFSDQRSKTLSYGSKVWDLSEVMVEDGSTLSLSSTQGHIIHVNGGSLVKFFNGNVEVKNGHLWVINSSSSKGTVSSPNTIAEFTEGQFIYSFDNISGRTQLLVLTGDVKFANALEPNLKINVASGHFSLVDKEYEQGLPRVATKVGIASYKKMKGVFADFKNLQESKLDEMIISKPKTKKKIKRSIASVNDQFSEVPINYKRGRIIHMKTFNTSRTPASTGPMSYYQDMKKEQALKNKPLRTNKEAPIKYYGRVASSQKVVKTTNQKPLRILTNKTNRMPASVKPARVPASAQKMNLINDLKKSGFEKSLKKEAPKIQRHSDEVNHLIDELKSFEQDFKKTY